MLDRCAAIVEGHTEKQFFEYSLPNVMAMRTIKNGQSLETLLDSIVTSVQTVPYSRQVIFIWFDRENLPDCCSDLEDQVRSAIAPYVQGKTVYVGIPDREVENWLLADIHGATDSEIEYDYTHEGIKGKPVFENVCGLKSPGDKARALKRARPSIIAQRSPSFQLFYNRWDRDWHWMAK